MGQQVVDVAVDVSHHKLLERRRVEGQLETLALANLLGRIAGLLQAEIAEFAHSLRPHQRQINTRPQCEQPLIRADIAGGFFAADVLFAGLQREHEAALAAPVDRLSADAAGHSPQEFLATGQNAQVGAAVKHRRAERLALGHDDVGSQFARPPEQAQAHRVDRYNQQRADIVGGQGDSLDVFQRAEEVGVLNQHAGRLVGDLLGESRQVNAPIGRCDRDQFRVDVGQIGLQNLAILGMYRSGRHDATGTSRGGQAHQHRFGRRAAAVVNAGVRDVHAGQLRNQRLVFKRRLQIALADFWLIRSVRRIKLTPRRDKVDHRGHEMIVAAAAQKANAVGRRLILPGQLRHVPGHFHFRHGRRNVQVSAQPNFLGHHREQLVERFDPDRLEHLLLVSWRVDCVGHRSSLFLALFLIRRVVH